MFSVITSEKPWAQKSPKEKISSALLSDFTAETELISSSASFATSNM